jgi:hypothetical protein
MGIRIGAGLGPISVSARVGGGGGGGGGDGDGFWIFVCIFAIVASGVPMAFEMVRDFVSDKSFWIVVVFGVIPSITLLFLHASLISTKRGGRLVFNSYPTMFLALPASGYEIIMFIATDNQTGWKWLIYLSLIPFGLLHWFWIRWTTQIFSAVPRATNTARWQARRDKRIAEQAVKTAALRAKHQSE